MKIIDKNIKYCWLRPDLTFSISWDEEIHSKYITKSMIERANKDNLTLIKYEILTENNFEFPYETTFRHKNFIK